MSEDYARGDSRENGPMCGSANGPTNGHASRPGGRDGTLATHIDALTITDQDGMIGERIDLARRLAGLTPEELAAQASLPPEQLSAFGRGTGGISLRAFLRMAAVLGVTAEWLCGPTRPAGGRDPAVTAHWELERLRTALEGRSDAERELLVGFVRDVARRFHLASRDLSSQAARRIAGDFPSGHGEVVPFPLPAPAPTPVPAAPPATPIPAVTGRVLVVDDSADVLVALGAFVESAGFEAVRAASADEAMAKLSADPGIIAVVTDYAMPDVSGVELLVQAAQVRPGLPAMVVTGFPDLAALTRLPIPVAVLRKPFRRQEFVSRLKVLVEGAATSAPGRASGRAETAGT